jgi:WXG100 family type VII secretion target
MANVNVTYQELEDSARFLLSGENDLKTKFNELKARIDSLTASGFVTDMASGAYSDTYNTFTTNMTTAVSALDTLAQYLMQASQAMQSTDQQLSQQFSQG